MEKLIDKSLDNKITEKELNNFVLDKIYKQSLDGNKRFWEHLKKNKKIPLIFSVFTAVFAAVLLTAFLFIKDYALLFVSFIFLLSGLANFGINLSMAKYHKDKEHNHIDLFNEVLKTMEINYDEKQTEPLTVEQIRDNLDKILIFMNMTGNSQFITAVVKSHYHSEVERIRTSNSLNTQSHQKAIDHLKTECYVLLEAIKKNQISYTYGDPNLETYQREIKNKHLEFLKKQITENK